MYLENIEIMNYGAIEKLSYKLPFNEDGTPQSVVLVGKNGAGKTLLLSNIIHSLIEMKRKAFPKLEEVSENNFYRLAAKDYIKKGQNYAYIYYEFSNNIYTDLMVNNYDKFKNSEYKNEIHREVNIDDNELSKYGFYCKTSEPERELFDKDVFLYFPADRYYTPKWLNKANTKLCFNVENKNLVGKADGDMIRDNINEDIENWILDVIIDKLLYEGRNIPSDTTFNENDKTYTIKERVKYSGKNSDIQGNINSIVNKIFNNNYVYTRIGISSKAPRKISIMCKKADNTEEEIIPNFTNISSGEMMVLAMFCSILKEFDRVTGNNNSDIKEIRGIVLIDEIDLHLHSDFAKEVLPNIIDTFPKIQFIVSSHSPFFLLGMNKMFGDRCKFLSLPNGLIMNNIENFEEIQKSYEMLDKNHLEMTLKLQEYEEKIKLLDKPLIITEGKTDWKHIKNALETFKEKGEFTELDVSFKEYEDADISDSKLETLLINLAKVNQSHKIIGIFDNDSEIGKRYLISQKIGNNANVWACCLPTLSEYPCGISIEMLYNIEDIKMADKSGRRLYMSNEFTEKGMRLTSDVNINTLNNAVKGFYTGGIIKIIDNEVYDSEGKSMALSKNEFAENIRGKVQPFDKINVERFKGVFETLSKILTE